MARFVRVEEPPVSTRYIVGAGCKRAGSRGTCIAIISLKHSLAYEIVLKLDNGKIDSFSPMQLFPESGHAADR